MTTTPEGTVRAARAGARGWHFIAKAKYDAAPGDFVLVDEAGKAALPSGDGPVEIPADWSDLHHMKKIALAEKITGADLVLADGQTKTEAAEVVIKAEVERRAANG